MHTMFKRFRCIVSGQSAEDVNDFGRTTEVVYRLMSATARQKYCNENFEIDNIGDNFIGKPTYLPLEKGDHVIQMPLLISGILGPKQHRMLPLRLMGSCVIELELDEVTKWAA